MKYAVMSDVHANPDALAKAVDDARTCGAETFVCLGDIVGYGPSPDEAIILATGIRFSPRMQTCRYGLRIMFLGLGVQNVGRDREYDVLSKFGIGTRTEIGFAGESAGRLFPPERCSRMQLTRIPIGQGVEITAIQIARAYATLANHGERIDPYAVRRIVNASGETLYEHFTSTNKVRTVSREAADSTCGILEGSVKASDLKGFNGLHVEDPPNIAKSLVSPRATGRRAAVEGVRIAGKTSTVQRMKPDSYEYYFDRYIASFAGFFPADAPKYALVVCYETKSVDGVPYIHQGGGRPAMAFAEVVRRMGYGKTKQ